MKIRIIAAAAVIACVAAGCGGISAPHTAASPATTAPAAATSASALASPSAAPAPVSTTASLTGNCVMGYEWTPNSTDAATGVFISGPPAPGTSDGDPALAYQLTLANNSSVTADVSGFAVVFYTGSAEAGSDQEQASGFITPGQSLAWTVIEDHTVREYGDDPNQQLTQTGSIPAGAATCQLVQWSHP
jgi:hypothetical protein